MRTILARGAGVLAVALLAGLSGCLVNKYNREPVIETAGCTTRGVCPPAEDEKPLADLCGFGMRPAAVLEATGFKADDLPYLKHFRAKVGIALKDVKAFAVVCFDNGERRALLVQSTYDINQGNVIMACEAGDPRTAYCRGEVYTGKSGLAVHFPSLFTALITDSPETMKQCLKQLPMLTAHLDEADKHHVSAWGRAIPRKPAVPVTSCRLFGPLFRPMVHTAAKVAVPPKADDEMTMDFLPLPVPHKAKSARITMDLGPTANITCTINFADEESAKLGKDVVAGYMEMGRGGLVLLAAQLALMRCSNGLSGGLICGGTPEVEKDVLAAIPFDLMKRTEKAMQDVAVKAEGKRVAASLRVPLQVEDRALLQKLFALLDPICCKGTLEPGLFFESKKAAPDIAPCVPVTPPPISGCGPRSAIRAAEQPPPLPEEPRPVVPPLTPPPAPSWTLTVANVLREESVLLFTVDQQGELTFVKKVQPGDAVDLPTVQGQRWAAVFMSEPYRTMHTVSGDKQVFLIRPAPVTPPCTTAPVTLN
jgi:hypothetical protein